MTHALAALEGQLLDQVSADRLISVTAALAQWDRVSGTEGERAGVAILRRELEGFGLTVIEHRFECLLGWPESASLRTEEGDEHPVLGHSFSPSTGPGGIDAEITFAGPAAAADLTRCRGRVALFDGHPGAASVRAADEAGALAAVFIQLDDELHNAHTTPVWGNPTTRTASLLPRLPSVSIGRSNGEQLLHKAASGGLRVHLETRTFRGWREVPLITAEIPGAADPETFVLMSGHHDSWHRGAMDNASACATMVEVARILSARPGHLFRGLRLAFFPGHSQGTYAGSTWYADNFWEELHDRCLLQITVDSTGARGANVYRATVMPETERLGVEAIRDAIGIVPDSRPINRQQGDQSFWGCGVPSVFITLSAVPPELAVNKVKGQPLSGTPWFWHTPADTIDKIDPEVLRLDTRVYLLAALRSAGRPLVPLLYQPAAAAIRRAVDEYGAAAPTLELDLVRERAQRLETLLGEADAALEQLDGGTGLAPARARLLAAALQAVEREMVVLNFTAEGPFEQDPDLVQPELPLLARAVELGRTPAGTDHARHLSTELVRRRNQVAFHLRSALTAAEGALSVLQRRSPVDGEG